MGEKATYRDYSDLLWNYLTNKDEKSLYKAQQLSRHFLEEQTSPEDLISMHYEVLIKMFPTIPEDLKASFDFLMEIMMSYGLAYREHQSLRLQQIELQSEISVAASMQKTLLNTQIPELDDLDIGAISVPSKQMNGDYHHFVQDEDGCLGVAIADVIGKGIPAALCMSMIKYSMDSLPETRMAPGAVLGSLNRVVERNVDDSMFITMFYGLYDPRVHRFFYSSAGHEPGFYYSKEKGEFTELATKGLVLGVSKNATYAQYEMQVNCGDMIILLSDGVTECRSGEQFIERKKIVELIERNIHFSAQQIARNVYAELERLQDFELRDDFTLIILRRQV